MYQREKSEKWLAESLPHSYPSCSGHEDDKDKLILPKPSWQLYVTLVSMLVTPPLYRLYSLLATIGLVLFSNDSNRSSILSVGVFKDPKVELSWTGLFPCEQTFGWRESAITVALLSVVVVTCYSLIVACLLWMSVQKTPIEITFYTTTAVQVTSQVRANTQEMKRSREVLESAKTVMLIPALNLYMLLIFLLLLLQAGDVELNPGPLDAGCSKHPYARETVKACGVKITEGFLSDPKGFALVLHAKELIPSCTFEKVNELNETKREKAQRLYSAVLRSISPENYFDLIGIFEENQVLYRELLKELEETYNEKEKAAQQKLESSPEVQHKVKSTSKMGATSALDMYQTYLKSVYSIDRLPVDAKYDIGSTEHFVNLACIDSQSTSSTEDPESTQCKARGDIGKIFATHPRIEIDKVAAKNGDSYPKLVLVKGAPGVGKTTFSWELCRRWKSGQLLKDYSHVILLSLRDESVQETRKIVDLFQCGDDLLSTRIVEELRPTQGQGVLFILEGLDELPKSLRQDKNSIFMALIRGSVLPASTVVVTARPWATSCLPVGSKNRIDQHVEILGFTKEHINEYIDHMIREGVPRGFRKYIDMNPQLFSAMYNPLQARITVEVYKESSESQNCVFPNTMTELYTAFSTVILQRHLKDHPAEEQWDGEDFSMLPPPVLKHFTTLCKIAYEGTIKEEQQLAFSKIDIPPDIETLGFMNSVQPLHRRVTRACSPSYNFIHFTLQEYLAAVYIWKNHTTKQHVSFFKSTQNEMKRVVQTFLAGLTKFEDDYTKNALPRIFFSTKTKLTTAAEIKEMSAIDSSHYVLWLYESQNVDLIISYGVISQNITLSFPTWNFRATPLDYFALGYCIAASKAVINLAIDLSVYDGIFQDNLEMFVAGIKRFPPAIRIKYLDLCLSHLLVDSQVCSLLFIDLFPHVLDLDKLSITYNNCAQDKSLNFTVPPNPFSFGQSKEEREDERSCVAQLKSSCLKLPDYLCLLQSARECLPGVDASEKFHEMSKALEILKEHEPPESISNIRTSSKPKLLYYLQDLLRISSNLELPQCLHGLLTMSSNLKEIDISEISLYASRIEMFKILAKLPCLEKAAVKIGTLADFDVISNFVATSTSLQTLVLGIPVLELNSKVPHFDDAFITFVFNANRLRRHSDTVLSATTFGLKRGYYKVDANPFPISNIYYRNTDIVPVKTVTQITEVIQNFRDSLKRLHLSNSCLMISDGLHELSKAISVSSSLNDIKLSLCPMENNTSGVAALAEVLTTHETVKTLCIRNLEAIEEPILLRLPITNLVSEEEIEPELLAMKLKYSKCLENVELSQDLAEHGMASIMDALHFNRSVKTLQIVESFLFSIASCACCIGPSNTSVTARMLEVNKTLEFLEIWYEVKSYDCEQVFLTSVAQALSKNTTLKTLKLWHDSSDDKVNDDVDISAFGDMLMLNKSLLYLYLSLSKFQDCGPLLRGLSANKTLRVLGVPEYHAKETIITQPEYPAIKERVQFTCL